MTTLALADSSALFADITDHDAELVDGGGLSYNLKVDPCGIKICYEVCLPGFNASGKVSIQFPKYGNGYT